jgi:hypothetical protein
LVLSHGTVVSGIVGPLSLLVVHATVPSQDRRKVLSSGS